MKITKDKVVSIHYTLTNDNGDVIDSSHARKEPLKYIHGRSQLIIGMEEGIEGCSKGDKKQLEIEPAKGYGERREEMIQYVPKDKFGDQEIKPGMKFQAGQQVITIVGVTETEVKVDGNHELAGETLHFDVEVMDVRDADASELDHGHVH